MEASPGMASIGGTGEMVRGLEQRREVEARGGFEQIRPRRSSGRLMSTAVRLETRTAR